MYALRRLEAVTPSNPVADTVVVVCDEDAHTTRRKATRRLLSTRVSIKYMCSYKSFPMTDLPRCRQASFASFRACPDGGVPANATTMPLPFAPSREG